MTRQPFSSQKGQPPKPPKLPLFAVVKIRAVEEGNLLAFVDLQIGEGPDTFTVRKWRLVQNPGKEPWLCPPQEIFTDATGTRRYLNLFEPAKAWIAPITETAIRAWEESRSSQEVKTNVPS